MNNIYVKLIRSPLKNKKYRMLFYIRENDKFKKILYNDFGGAGFSDYTIHKDKKRRKNYIARHIMLPNWDNFYMPSGLSRHILWEEPTIEEAFEKY